MREFAESGLSKPQLSRRYEDAQDEIDRCHEQIARQATANHNLQLQLENFQECERQLEMAENELEEAQRANAESKEKLKFVEQAF